MQERHAQPFLLIDNDRLIFDAANRALERLGRWRPLLLIPQLDAARQYLRDASRAQRLPAAIIIRVREEDDTAWSLVDWIHGQPEPLRSSYVLVISDVVVDEGHGVFDGWIENALAEALGAPGGRGVTGQAAGYPGLV